MWQRRFLSDDDLLRLVVVVFAEDEFLAVVGPAGEGAGGLLDVVLGVVADSEREQLHQLAGVVLIRVGLAVLRVVLGDVVT